MEGVPDIQTLMNFILLFSTLFIVTVFGGKSLNISEITAKCSKIVSDLEVKGIKSFVPTKSEAEENMKELGKIIKISKIQDQSKRQEKFKEHPELKKLLKKLKKIKKLEKMSEEDKFNTLKSNEKMLETVVRLSMLDTTNKHSPIYGKNISKLLGNGKKALKRKYHKRDGMMQLMYSKVIPPGRKMPDTNKIQYTDDKGRQCICSC